MELYMAYRLYNNSEKCELGLFATYDEAMEVCYEDRHMGYYTI